MNNLNIPFGNNEPEPGGGNKWNYALLVPMLGLAAFRWIWSRESQKEISAMKVWYLEKLTVLELELEKERQRVEVYKKEREKEWQRQATASLKELEDQLIERQHIYCSHFHHHSIRLEMEKKMLLKATREPIEGVRDLEADLKNIFKKDKHCAEYGNVNKRNNGSLMWLYLKYWQEQVNSQKHDAAK